MPILLRGYRRLTTLSQRVSQLDFLGLLLLRLYLAPIFILAGWGKLAALEDTAYYFSEYLNMPAPMLMAILAGSAELIGGISLLLGIGVRLFSMPLMITMVVAAVTAHWENGWHVLPETTLTVPWEWREDLLQQAAEQKQQVIALVQQQGDYAQLTEAGSITILKNGIEFTATYFVMLLMLFFYGAGRYISIDFWLNRALKPTYHRPDDHSHIAVKAHVTH